MRLRVFLALLCLASPSNAQVLRFERLTQDDGLTLNNVTCFAQDSFGFLWIGTQDGLNRWDGAAFRRFRPDGTATALQNGHVRAVAAVAGGKLWVATREGGLSLWDPAAETFTTWRHDKGRADSLGDDAVNTLLANEDGSVWAGHFGGLDLVDPNRGALTHLLSQLEVQLVARGPEGTLWVLTRDGRLLSADAKGKSAEHASPAGPFTAIAGTEGGHWLAGTRDGALLEWNPISRAFDRTDGPTPAAQITDVHLDRKGTLWVATRGAGVLRRDAASSALRAIRSDPSDPHSLPSDHVNQLFEDGTGVLWFGTESGLASHDPASAAFRVFRAGQGSLADGYVWAARADREGNLWVGTNGGASRRDRATGEWRNFAANPDDPKALASETVAAILVDRTGAVWLGGSRGLSRYDPANGAFTSWRRDGKAPVLPGRVWSLLETRDGRILAGTGNGLVERDASGGFVNPLPGFGAAVFSMAEEPGGALWLGTFYNGLYRLEPGAAKVSRGFPFEPQQISVTYVDSRGRLWIGTTQGLFRRDAAGSPLRHYRIREGLPNESIMGVVEDAAGEIWVSTNEGIVRLDPERHVFHGFTTRDGLPSNEFNQMAAGRTPAGEILLGTPAGLLVFDPRAIVPDANPPKVAITGLEVMGSPVPIGVAKGFSLARSILTTESLRLTHRERIVTFTFAALHFAASHAARFRWQLAGWDETWHESDASRRSVTYTNLPAGRYRLEVRAANRDGVWSRPGASLELQVLPPPWRTWWAYTLYLVGAAGAVAAVFVSRTRALRRRQRELEQLVALRTDELQKANAAKSVFLANMSHELRTPLNAVLGFAQLLERSAAMRGEDRKSLDVIRRAGTHLLGLINDVLSLSKIEAGRLTLDEAPFSLKGALESVESMMRVRAEKAGLALSCEVQGELPPAVVGDEGKLRQVLVNLMGNAVKFTASGGVTLRAAWRDGRARFEVEDSGHGIAPVEQATLFEAFVQTESGRRSKEGTGLGLVISREVVRLMGGDIRVKSELGKGSCFAFEASLPVAASAGEAAERRVVGLAAGERSRKVVVADDVAENRLLVVRLLESVGLEVLEAGNGEEAVALWERERPDLILMDLRMPVLDGRDATRLLRGRERAGGLPRTPVLALTASAFEHEREEILSCGADGFLAKPFTEAQLLGMIGRHAGVRFRTEEESPVAADSLAGDRIARLSEEEVRELRDALERGDVEKAAEAATRLRLRDEDLGRELLAEVRAYRVDHLLDLLEQRG